MSNRFDFDADLARFPRCYPTPISTGCSDVCAYGGRLLDNINPQLDDVSGGINPTPLMMLEY